MQLVGLFSKEGNKKFNLGLGKTLRYNTFNYPLLPDYIISIIYLTIIFYKLFYILSNTLNPLFE